MKDLHRKAHVLCVSIKKTYCHTKDLHRQARELCLEIEQDDFQLLALHDRPYLTSLVERRLTNKRERLANINAQLKQEKGE